MKQSGALLTPWVISLLVLLIPSPLFSQVDISDSLCGQEASCDIHPMLQALVEAHAHCDCNRVTSGCASCAGHPMIAALVEAYQKDPSAFTRNDWPAHPMIRAVIESGYECPDISKPCGCCRSPMIREIVDRWRHADGAPPGKLRSTP